MAATTFTVYLLRYTYIHLHKFACVRLRTFTYIDRHVHTCHGFLQQIESKFFFAPAAGPQYGHNRTLHTQT